MSEQRELAQAIARALGPEWTTRENEHTDYLVGPDIKLHVELDTYGANRQLHIRLAASQLNQYHSIREEWPGIGVNPTRTPAAIARDIERRLLPDARAMLAKLVERREQAIAKDEACQALLSRIADTLGVPAPLPESHHGRNHEMYAYLPVGTVHVESYGDTATLKLASLPAEVAVAVCKLLREATGGNN